MVPSKETTDRSACPIFDLRSTQGMIPCLPLKCLFFRWASLRMSCLFVSKVVTEFFYCNEQEFKSKSHTHTHTFFLKWLSIFFFFFCGNFERQQLCEDYHSWESHHSSWEVEKGLWQLLLHVCFEFRGSYSQENFAQKEPPNRILNSKKSYSFRQGGTWNSPLLSKLLR